MSTVSLSEATTACLKFSIDTVMPSSILDAPAHAAWPPPLTANGHWYNREASTSVETSSVNLGLNTQDGRSAPCCADQYAPVKVAYAEASSLRTCSEPKRIAKAVHCVLLAMGARISRDQMHLPRECKACSGTGRQAQEELRRRRRGFRVLM